MQKFKQLHRNLILRNLLSDSEIQQRSYSVLEDIRTLQDISRVPIFFPLSNETMKKAWESDLK